MRRSGVGDGMRANGKENGECAAKVHGEGEACQGPRRECYEPFTSPLYGEGHIFVVLAKKAAKAGVGEGENDEGCEGGECGERGEGIVGREQ